MFPPRVGPILAFLVALGLFCTAGTSVSWAQKKKGPPPPPTGAPTLNPLPVTGITRRRHARPDLDRHQSRRPGRAGRSAGQSRIPARREGRRQDGQAEAHGPRRRGGRPLSDSSRRRRGLIESTLLLRRRSAAGSRRGQEPREGEGPTDPGSVRRLGPDDGGAGVLLQVHGRGGTTAQLRGAGPAHRQSDRSAAHALPRQIAPRVRLRQRFARLPGGSADQLSLQGGGRVRRRGPRCPGPGRAGVRLSAADRRLPDGDGPDPDGGEGGQQGLGRIRRADGRRRQAGRDHGAGRTARLRRLGDAARAGRAGGLARIARRQRCVRKRRESSRIRTPATPTGCRRRGA